VQTLLTKLNPDPQGDIVYLCGNPSMVDACHELLTQHEFELKNIRREKYISR
jgi:NAD(P)H-flavin reductase